MAILYALVARATVVLSEFSAITGNTGAVARRLLEKLPAETDSSGSASKNECTGAVGLKWMLNQVKIVSIPSSLGLLPNLRGVQLFNNKLSGSIPSSLGYCPLLQSLDLSNNLLTGTIPDSIASSTKLYWLNLSFNSFSGQIPATLTHSVSLTFLDFQHNNLSGSIPNTWGGSVKSGFFRLQSLILDHNLFTGNIPSSLGKNSDLAAIVDVGLPCYSLLQTLIFSIKSNSNGVLLSDGFEINYLNRPKGKLLDWFFNPVMVLKEQIRVNKLEESEVRYLERVLLFGSDTQRMQACDNHNSVLQDAVRAAQIQGLARRMIGMVRSVSKLPTYRRKFKQVVKALVTHSIDNDISGRSGRSMISKASDENV